MRFHKHLREKQDVDVALRGQVRDRRTSGWMEKPFTEAGGDKEESGDPEDRRRPRLD